MVCLLHTRNQGGEERLAFHLVFNLVPSRHTDMKEFSSMLKNINVFHTARFHTRALFSFDFPLSFLTCLLATLYVPCSLQRRTQGS